MSDASADHPADPADAIAIWRQLLPDPALSWVLFRHGSCVSLPGAPADAAAQATALLRAAGPVAPGTASADFDVHPLADLPGWVVSCHHPAILVHVRPGQVGGADAALLDVGLVGRDLRDQDAQRPEVVAVHLAQA